MGEYLHGFYHKDPYSAGQRFHVCGGGSVDQICSLLRHSDTVFSVTGGRVVLQGGLSLAWTS